ncbi:MAG: DUF2281 domain-containing protein [Bacteroidetes bacterium]|nr:DUF2281 domain-containing protein [Bacteroidota bacterium]MBU2586348.1 DUF2281 domain-containing protein [Bacteroidota bacterium]
MIHKETLINKTVSFLEKMSEDRIVEVLHFAEFLQSKYEEEILQKGIEELSSKSSSFKYLEKEKDIYTVSDLKEKYK